MRFVCFNLLLFTFIILCSCGKILDLLSKDVDTEYRTDIKSKYNDDNTIFIEGKEYRYNVIQKNQDQVINFELVLKMIPGNYNGETKIKYKYFYSQEGLTEEQILLCIDTVKGFKWEVTSAEESLDYFDMHPPRSYTLNKMELAPFPKIYLPAVKDQENSNVFKIGPGWGDYSFSSIYWQYKIDDVIYRNDSSYIAKIKASSNWGKEENENKICDVNFEFNSKLGFTKMVYTYTDSTHIEFLMK